MNGADEPLVLTTKLFPPTARTELVRRTRLTERLSAGLARPVTVISAPAGSGKTTLVADWRADRSALRIPLAWLALDAGENDPKRFLAHIVAALRTTQPGIGAAALQMLQANAQTPARAILLHLINELAAELSPCVLALDDYHAIESQEAQALVETLVAYQPPDLRLLILSRHEPPLPLARLRARAELSELRADELRFTRPELEAFLMEKRGALLSEDELDALEQRTEGWAAGVQLAALAYAGAATEHMPTGFSGSYPSVFDYLASETLGRLPPGLQQFLLKTSVLDRFCGPLVDAMLGSADSRQRIEELERLNLFIIPLDAERHWHRFHHLFGEFLRARLEREEPHAGAELLDRASEWFEQHGLIEEAIAAALRSGSFERAAALIETIGYVLLPRGEFATFNGWMSALPEAIMRERPALLIFHAWSARSTGQVALSEQRVRDVERWCGVAVTDDGAFALPAERRHWLGQAALVEATYAHAAGQTERALTLFQRSYALLEDDDSPTGKISRPVVAVSIGTGLFAAGGDVGQAERFFRDAIAEGRALGNTYAVVIALPQLGRLLVSQGRLDDALTAFHDGLAYFDANFMSSLPVTAQLHVGIADVYRERGDFEAAHRHLNAALSSPELNFEVSAEIVGPVVRSRLLAAQGDQAAAHAALKPAFAATATGSALTQPLAELPGAMQARLWVAEGRLREATYWAEQAGELEAVRGPELVARTFAALTLTRIWIADGHPERALALLAPLREATERGARNGQLLEVDMLHALAAHACGDDQSAFGALTLALRRAERSGYLRTLADEGAQLARLLQNWLVSRDPGEPAVSVAYLGRLCEALGFELPLPRKRRAYQTPQNLPEPLSDREIEILRLLALGRSNREIGEQLFITTGTVKRHSHNIFRKLGARNRVEAGARGRELGLV